MKADSNLRHFWHYSRRSSTGYKFAQTFAFVAFFAFFLLYSYPFFDASKPQIAITFISRALIEGILFVLLSHFLLRSTFKFFLVQQQFRFRHFVISLLMLFLASLILSLISLGINLLALFQLSDMSSIVYQNVEGTSGLHMTFNTSTLLAMFFSMYFFLFLVWSSVYGFGAMLQTRKELQKQVQEARIQQLTNQLSPHFLFNAFNSIRAMVYEDQDKAAQLVTQLSELFRFHLQAHLSPASSLEEEWEISQKYLQIEKVRLEQRLQIEVDIDHHLWQQKLPTLSLLTLLENAIKHGLLLKFGDINRIVRLHEICRFESIGNHAAVYSPYGKSFIHSSLAKIGQKLNPAHFFKASRADIIRIDAIAHIEPSLQSGSLLAILKDKQEVDVSRRQAKALKARFSGL